MSPTRRWHSATTSRRPIPPRGQVLNVGTGGGQRPDGCCRHPVVTSSGPKPLATAPAGTTTRLSLRNDCSCLVNSIRSGDRTKTSAPSQHSPGIGRPKGGSSKATPLPNRATKGIDISGQKGQPPFTPPAAAKGLRGQRLQGYGKLIILKHNDDYLSAYAHNDELRVKRRPRQTEQLSPIWVVRMRRMCACTLKLGTKASQSTRWAICQSVNSES